MNKLETYILSILSILLITGCANSEDVDFRPVDNTVVPVCFDTYTSTTINKGTRAVNPTNITTTEELQQQGFGVFAYYTDNSIYPLITEANKDYTLINNGSVKPNFMFNQKVEWNATTSAWEYHPIKYWPNEYGQEGASETDCVSFFAYAPYSDFSTEIFQSLYSNNDLKDPVILYTLPGNDVTKCVDILAGVNPETGIPNINMTKQTVQEKVQFLFKHALSRMSIDVRGVYDEVEAGAKEMIDPYKDGKGTKITIESIDINGVSLPASGEYNLYTRKWIKSTETPITNFHFEGDVINPNLKDPGESEAKTASNLPTGVTATAQDAFTDDRHYTLISPSEAQSDVKVTITYYVNTYDPSLILTGGLTRVKNKIQNTETITLAFEEGKSYTLHLLLGMTTVKFSVEVDDWKEPIVFNPTVKEWEDDKKGITVAGNGSSPDDDDEDDSDAHQPVDKDQGGVNASDGEAKQRED